LCLGLLDELVCKLAVGDGEEEEDATEQEPFLAIELALCL